MLSDEITKFKLAKWSDRFLAWLIDMLIISIVSTIVISVVMGEFVISMDEESIWSESTSYIPTSILFFAYWSILEYKTGQSIGKKVFRLKLVSTDGGEPGLKGALISSFGKAFLIPIDVILGWLFTNNDRQRIFNRISDTLVVKIPASNDMPTFEKD